MEAPDQSEYRLHTPVIDIPVNTQVPSLDILYKTIQHVLSRWLRDRPDVRSIRCNMRQHSSCIVTHLDTVTGRVQKLRKDCDKLGGHEAGAQLRYFGDIAQQAQHITQ